MSTTSLAAMPAARITARLDRMPMTRTIWRMAFLISLGGFFDLYAISLIGALAPGLFKAKIFTATTVSFFGMSGLASFIGAFFLGLFIGTIAFSYVADRFGRRSIFAFRCCGMASPASLWRCRTRRTP
jgi:MFS transporter, putative metabolite:H+ symporter